MQLQGHMQNISFCRETLQHAAAVLALPRTLASRPPSLTRHDLDLSQRAGMQRLQGAGNDGWPPWLDVFSREKNFSTRLIGAAQRGAEKSLSATSPSASAAVDSEQCSLFFYQGLAGTDARQCQRLADAPASRCHGNASVAAGCSAVAAIPSAWTNSTGRLGGEPSSVNHVDVRMYMYIYIYIYIYMCRKQHRAGWDTARLASSIACPGP
ncbi:hypothetical protein ACJQWK_00240 [Exserohilum turcicum]